MSDIAKLEQQILADIAASADEAALEAVRVAALGRNGTITALLKTLGAMTPDERRVQGPKINGLKDQVTDALTARRDALKNAALDARLNTETVDVTLPVREPPTEQGRIHPITQVTDELTAIFADMGFAVAEGPDIETDDLNFTKLNIPEGHPAREMHDTFFFNPKQDGSRMLLRTHTSPVQVRTLQKYPPPIRILAPGTVFRRDPFDASHAPAFAQLEGLAIDEGISFVDLKATLTAFARRFFGSSTKTRFRPSYFPFTEPSAEMDVECRLCGGAGCSACKGTGWMEIMGSGMVHPSVLEAAGIDSEHYTGWAFGMGPGRIAMLRYGLPDIRLLYDSDVRFLTQVAE
jgi:phenylalanyl-tRNA synthetase alpha chain